VGCSGRDLYQKRLHHASFYDEADHRIAQEQRRTEQPIQHAFPMCLGPSYCSKSCPGEDCRKRRRCPFTQPPR